MQPRLQGLEHLHLCLYIAPQWHYTASKKEIGNFMSPQQSPVRANKLPGLVNFEPSSTIWWRILRCNQTTLTTQCVSSVCCKLSWTRKNSMLAWRERKPEKEKSLWQMKKKQLCQSMFHVSQEPAIGNRQKNQKFWERIAKPYQNN